MVDILIAWIMGHPLQSIAIMTLIAALSALPALRTELSELLHRDHPRC